MARYAKGYSELTITQKAMLEELKGNEAQMNTALDTLLAEKLIDPRLAAVTRTQFELGYMAFAKAVAVGGEGTK